MIVLGTILVPFLAKKIGDRIENHFDDLNPISYSNS